MNTIFLQITRGSPLRQALARLVPSVKAPPANPVDAPAATPVATTVRRKKILIVDDDPIILNTISMKLTSEGYDVVWALDAPGAIGAMRDEKPDLILLDLSFPPDVANGGCLTWDGFQIMSWLRGLEGSESVPFIIITAGDPAEYRKRSLASGALAFFHKPIDHGDLLKLLRETLKD